MSNLAKVQNSAKTNEWGTPQWLFDVLNLEFNFAWDLACTEKNKKVKNGLVDSLEVDWHKLAPNKWLWLNPPYSPLRPWIEKTQEEYKKGAKIVMLIPPQTPAAYFVKTLPAEIRYISGRINFIAQNGKPAAANTRDSAIYIYGPPSTPVVSFLTREELKRQAQFSISSFFK